MRRNQGDLEHSKYTVYGKRKPMEVRRLASGGTKLPFVFDVSPHIAFYVNTQTSLLDCAAIGLPDLFCKGQTGRKTGTQSHGSTTLFEGVMTAGPPENLSDARKGTNG